MTNERDDYLEKALSAAFSLEDGPTDLAAVSARWRSAATAPLPESLGRYQIESLIARGGTGLVLEGRDADLDRTVAVKILHDHLADDPEMVRLFVEEARTSGRLDHPGIIAVHELGFTETGCPWFAMKLVEGETLGAMLHARSSTQDSLLRFLSSFEQICQIVAFAHSRGVVHLDLKPSNVLVGAFGEILVTDWGFSAVHKHVAAGPGRSKQARIVGTPAYMPPEQARGEVAKLSPRSDVFALGAILCEILTGRPPYGEDAAGERLLHASKSWLDGAWRRLADCGAEPFLVDLCRRCLSPEPDDRPSDAADVATTVADYLRRLDERARDAASKAAAAELRAENARRERRLVRWFAAIIVGVVILGAMVAIAVERDRSRRGRADERLIASMMERCSTRIDRAEAAAIPSPELWQVALAELQETSEAATARNLTGATVVRITELLETAEKGLGHARRDRRLMEELSAIHERQGDHREAAAKDADYARAFREAGVDIDGASTDHAIAAARILTIGPVLLTALDDWTEIRTRARGLSAAKAVADVASSIDDDPWRASIRAALIQRQTDVLEKAAGESMDSHSAEALALLAQGLIIHGRQEAAARVLERAAELHPDDYEIHHRLGILRRSTASLVDYPDSVREFSMALAIRPESAHAMADLGQAFLLAGDTTRAIRILEEARRRDPTYAPALHFLGVECWRKRDYREAERYLREATAQDPGFAMSWVVLAVTLARTQQHQKALEAIEQAIAIDPRNDAVVDQKFLSLMHLGRFREAREWLEAHVSNTDDDRPGSPAVIEAYERRIAEMKHFEALRADWDRIRNAGPEALEDGEIHVVGMCAWLAGDHEFSGRVFAHALEERDLLARLSPSDKLFASRSLATVGLQTSGTPELRPEEYRSLALEVFESAVAGLDAVSKSGHLEGPLIMAFDSAFYEPTLAPYLSSEPVSPLSAAERTAWSEVWSKLRAILDRRR